MHTVLKKSLLALLLAGAAAGTAHAADLVHQASNKALLPPLPGEASYLNEADLLSVTGATATGAQAQQPAVSPIPEPPVYLMLLIGVGLVSLVARRSSPPPKFSTET
jgi:hypothetical protein